MLRLHPLTERLPVGPDPTTFGVCGKRTRTPPGSSMRTGRVQWRVPRRRQSVERSFVRPSGEEHHPQQCLSRLRWPSSVRSYDPFESLQEQGEGCLLRPRCQQTERTHPCRLQTPTKGTSVRSSSLPDVQSHLVLVQLEGCDWSPGQQLPWDWFTGNRWTLLRISERSQRAQIARCQIATFQHLSCRGELAQHHQPLSPSNFPVLICVAPALPHNSCPCNGASLSTLFNEVNPSAFGESCNPLFQLCGRDFATSRRSSEKHTVQEEEQLPSAFFAGHIIPIVSKNSLVHRSTQCSSESSTHQERDHSHDVRPAFEN